MIAGHPGIRHEEERLPRRRWDAEWAKMLQDEGILEFVRAWEDLPLFRSQRELEPSLRVLHRARRQSHDASGIAWAFSRLGLGRMPSYWADIQGLEQPVDYLVGALDTRYLEIGRELVARCVRGRLLIAPDCGHDLVLEAPEWVAERLDESRGLGYAIEVNER